MCKPLSKKKESYLTFFLLSFNFPSTILDTIIDAALSPTTFKTVAGASIIAAIIVKIGSDDNGNPNKVIISISLIDPPPTGTALIKSVAISETNTIFATDILLVMRSQVQALS